MSLPSNFCVAPFHRFETSNGNCGPCSYTPGIFDLSKYKTIHEKWNSPEYEKFRQSFLDNEQDPLCHVCWQEEKAGQTSLRQRLNTFRGTKNVEKAFEQWIDSKKYKIYPKVVTLIPGNQCNLACVICYGNFSSKWNSEISNFPKNDIFKNAIYKNWNMNKEEYKDIVDNSEHIQRLELFGGEPFYNKKNKTELIDPIIKKGTAKNMTIYFNTNCTQWDEAFIKKLESNFKKVEIRGSIDGIDKQFEYLRYGARWDNTIENIKKFTNISNGDFEIICTISPYNVLYLEDYDNFFTKNNWPVRWNIITHPNEMLLSNIPEVVKNNLNLPEKFNFIQKYITDTPSDPNAWPKFVARTKFLDKQRKLSVKAVFPRFYELVKTHGFED